MNTYYLANVLIFAGVDIIACLALNLQFGVSGIVNFSFIIFQAAGAYAAAILSLPPHTSPDYSFEIYLGGYQLPFPLPWIGGAVVGGLLAIPIGLVALRKLRADYQAIALLVTSIIANTVINNARPLLNGAAGLANVPQPLDGLVDTSTSGYQYLYIGLTAVCVALVWFVSARIVNSPYGRTLRAMRDHELAATALGKNPVALKMTIFVVGGAIAGLSGAILVGFLQIWAPSTWLYPETIILFAAVIVGGRGNNLGAIFGALLVPVGFEESTRLLGGLNIGNPNLIPGLEWVCIGLLILGFLWFRPKGVLPEPRRVFPGGPVKEETRWVGSAGAG
ncbi:MAG TPA: branched-chain amino acid ABC transporter permease [Candidatus Dormibacteraeota bacterium]|jgi:branched-chain amino acid transport system permease protein|nr:branched-chain amino acid ABC transporter permease [Candidatus Dormibacteraeota bacterium]